MINSEVFRIDNRELLTPDNARNEIDKYLPGLLEGDHTIATFINKAEKAARVHDPYGIPFDFNFLLGDQIRRIRFLPDRHDTKWSLQWEHTKERANPRYEQYLPSFFSTLDGIQDNPNVTVFFHSLYRKYIYVDVNNQVKACISNKNITIPSDDVERFLIEGDRQIRDLEVTPDEVRFGYREIDNEEVRYQEDFVFPRHQPVVLT